MTLTLSAGGQSSWFLVPKTENSSVLIDGLEMLNEPDPDDRLPAIETSAVSVSGDLWQLGKHRVLCGNALITENYERLMGGAKADLVITDPPYNVAIDGHASGLGKVRHREFAMASGEMSSEEFTEFLHKAMTLSKQSSQPGSLAYYFMDWRHMKQILAAGLEVYGETMNLCMGQEQRRHEEFLSQCARINLPLQKRIGFTS